MILYNLTRSYILYVARFMFQIYVLDRQTDKQTDRQTEKDRQTDSERHTSFLQGPLGPRFDTAMTILAIL